MLGHVIRMPYSAHRFVQDVLVFNLTCVSFSCRLIRAFTRAASNCCLHICVGRLQRLKFSVSWVLKLCGMLKLRWKGTCWQGNAIHCNVMQSQSHAGMDLSHQRTRRHSGVLYDLSLFASSLSDVCTAENQQNCRWTELQFEFLEKDASCVQKACTMSSFISPPSRNEGPSALPSVCLVSKVPVCVCVQGHFQMQA